MDEFIAEDNTERVVDPFVDELDLMALGQAASDSFAAVESSSSLCFTVRTSGFVGSVARNSGQGESLPPLRRSSKQVATRETWCAGRASDEQGDQ